MAIMVVVIRFLTAIMNGGQNKAIGDKVRQGVNAIGNQGCRANQKPHHHLDDTQQPIQPGTNVRDALGFLAMMDV